MTFTKTSQKFGQWADSRANTVFGLGFASEQQLAKVRRDTGSRTRALPREASEGDPAGEDLRLFHIFKLLSPFEVQGVKIWLDL